MRRSRAYPGRCELSEKVEIPAEDEIEPPRAPAYDSGIGIAKVEVSTDNGQSWQETVMENAYGKYVWRVWHHRFTPRTTGQLTILSRAIGVTGESQPFEVSEQDIRTHGRRMNSVLAYGTRIEVV